MVHCPYVLAIYVKGQMLESRIKIRYPLHVDIFMLTFKQGLECPKGTCSEIGTMFQMHVIHITLVDLDSNHKVAHKHISHLCKLIKACTYSNSGKIQISPNKICKSHKCS